MPAPASHTPVHVEQFRETVITKIGKTCMITHHEASLVFGEIAPGKMKFSAKTLKNYSSGKNPKIIFNNGYTNWAELERFARERGFLG
jgi:hypothetical protein